jgi:proteasome component ECM29
LFEKVEEAAITALGHIALGSPDISSKVQDFFYSLPPILSKHVEVNFTVGEALCTLSGGWSCSLMEEYRDIADVAFPPTGSKISTPEPGLLEKVVQRCFQEIKPGGIPVARKGVCIWLLCLVKYCGKIDEIKVHIQSLDYNLH